jgi:hypothetical protein
MATVQELIQELEEFIGPLRTEHPAWKALREKIVDGLTPKPPVASSKHNPDDNTREDLAEGYKVLSSVK